MNTLETKISALREKFDAKNKSINNIIVSGYRNSTQLPTIKRTITCDNMMHLLTTITLGDYAFVYLLDTLNDQLVFQVLSEDAKNKPVLQLKALAYNYLHPTTSLPIKVLIPNNVTLPLEHILYLNPISVMQENAEASVAVNGASFIIEDWTFVLPKLGSIGYNANVQKIETGKIRVLMTGDYVPS